MSENESKIQEMSGDYFSQFLPDNLKEEKNNLENLEQLIKPCQTIDTKQMTLLGQGGEAYIYNMPDPNLVLKEYFRPKHDTSSQRSIKNEFIVMEEKNKLKNVLVAQECFQVKHGDSICIAFSLKRMMFDLFDLIAKPILKKHRESSNIVKILNDVEDGISSLHTIEYLHNDVKPENIGVYREKKSWRGMLMDVGMISKIENRISLENVDDKRKQSIEVRGTKLFLPTEEQYYNTEFDRDRFALGLCGFICVVGGMFFSDDMIDTHFFAHEMNESDFDERVNYFVWSDQQIDSRIKVDDMHKEVVRRWISYMKSGIVKEDTNPGNKRRKHN